MEEVVSTCAQVNASEPSVFEEILSRVVVRLLEVWLEHEPGWMRLASMTVSDVSAIFLKTSDAKMSDHMARKFVQAAKGHSLAFYQSCDGANKCSLLSHFVAADHKYAAAFADFLWWLELSHHILDLSAVCDAAVETEINECFRETSEAYMEDECLYQSSRKLCEAFDASLPPEVASLGLSEVGGLRNQIRTVCRLIAMCTNREAERTKEPTIVAFQKLPNAYKPILLKCYVQSISRCGSDSVAFVPLFASPIEFIWKQCSEEQARV